MVLPEQMITHVLISEVEGFAETCYFLREQEMAVLIRQLQSSSAAFPALLESRSHKPKNGQRDTCKMRIGLLYSRMLEPSAGPTFRMLLGG